MVIFIVRVDFILLEQKINLIIKKKEAKIKIFVELKIIFQSHKDIILKFNHYMKSDKTSCIIFADLESLIRKIDGCANNP